MITRGQYTRADARMQQLGCQVQMQEANKAYVLASALGKMFRLKCLLRLTPVVIPIAGPQSNRVPCDC